MKLLVQKATTDVSVYLFIQNSSVTTGAGLTGLAYNSASLVAYYVRPLGSATAITLATQTVTGAHSDGGFVEVDATNMPGVYRLDLPDAVCATGVNSVVVMLKGATNMAPVLLEIQLSSFNPNDSVRLGLTALPNAAADAAGGLPISDAGGLDLDAQIGTKINDILTDTGTTLQAELDGIQADTEDIQTRIPAALTLGGFIKADVLAVAGQTGAASGLSDAGVEYNGSATFPAAVQNIATDAIDAASIAADAGTELATAVWANATRTLTALDEDATTLDIDAAVAAAVTAALTTALTEGYRGTGATGSVRDLLYELIAHLGESAISSTTKTLKKLDGSTTAKTYTLDSATVPTSITETT